MKAPIVLIHGTNAGPWTMANFADFFTSNGYVCHCPAYRNHDPTPSHEQASQIKGLSIADYVEDIASYIGTLSEKPILIGHSLGGVVAQKLAARGLARAIILLNGSVNWGILPTTEQERELGRILISAGAIWEETLLPDFETMARFGLNRLATDEQHRVFDQLGPESGRVLFELFLWMFDDNQTTKINYDAIDCPILMVSGTEDLAIPPSTAKRIAQCHGELATFHEAVGFGHYLTLEADWRQIADLCAEWLDRHV